MSRDGLFVGLMSGTSMDGIDAALVRMEAGRPLLLHALNHPWPEKVRNRLAALRTPRVTLQQLGEADTLCAQAFAAATSSLLAVSGHSAAEIVAIGSHGQTLYHHPHPPAPFTLQIGDPNLIAQQTGITVVADFRRRDLAAGGQGAPLVPPFHHALFHDPQADRAVLNLGGIANLTLLPARGAVRGFDTGPGNCLMDRWIERHKGASYDRDGAWAAEGKVQPGLLESLLADPFFEKAPPKSTGTEYFSLAWLDGHLAAQPPLAPEDVQATLAALTVESVARALRQWQERCESLLVCGGGCHNPLLMKGLRRALPRLRIESTALAGVDPDWVEAMAFAWLAARTLAGEPGNLPEVTGARQAVVLGGIYPAH